MRGGGGKLLCRVNPLIPHPAARVISVAVIPPAGSAADQGQDEDDQENGDEHGLVLCVYNALTVCALCPYNIPMDRETKVNLRVSDTQKAEYDKAARSAGMALSVWMRLILDAAIAKMKEKS